MPRASWIAQMNVPSAFAIGVLPSRPRSNSAIDAFLSGAATGRLSLSSSENMNRTVPHVRSAEFEMTTGKRLGFCDETSQPGRSDGGVGAVAQAVVPLPAGPLAAVVGAALGFVPPHAAAVSASTRPRTATCREERDRGDM